MHRSPTPSTEAIQGRHIQARNRSWQVAVCCGCRTREHLCRVLSWSCEGRCMPTGGAGCPACTGSLVWQHVWKAAAGIYCLAAAGCAAQTSAELVLDCQVTHALPGWQMLALSTILTVDTAGRKVTGSSNRLIFDCCIADMQRSQAAAALPQAQVDPAAAFPNAVADGPDDFTARFRKATKKRAGPFDGRHPTGDSGAGMRDESSSTGAAGTSADVSHRSIDLQVRT